MNCSGNDLEVVGGKRERETGSAWNFSALDLRCHERSGDDRTEVSSARQQSKSAMSSSDSGKIHIPQKNVRRKMLMGSFASADGTKKSCFNKEKWLPAVYLPYRISNRCCSVMKKSPLAIYQRRTGRYPIIATMTCESSVRKQAWLRTGCNAFSGNHISSKPLSFWTEQDVLQYIKTFELPIASVYGEIVCDQPSMIENDCKLCTTGCNRTGCLYCGFGAHLEKGLDRRFLRLKETHPKLYDYALRGGAMGE